MELPLFIIYLIIWFWLTVKRKKHEGLYSTFFIFGLSVFAYFVLIPFEMYVRGEEYFFLYNWIRLGFYERNLIILLSIISLFGFYFGLKLSCYRLLPIKNFMKNNENGLNKNHHWQPVRILFCIITVCGFILIIFYRDLILAQQDYHRAYQITYESPFFSFIKTHFLIALGLTAGLIKRKVWRWKGKIISFAIVVLITYVGIFTSDKEPLLIALLTCASFIEFNKMSFRKFIIFCLLGSMCVIVLVLFFNIYRTRISFSEALRQIPWTEISFKKLDPAGPMVSLGTVIRDDHMPLRYGKTYINSICIIVPKAIWPNRPLILSEEFARDIMPDYSEGKGLGYSPLAEALLNFHVPGAFIHFFILAFLFGSFFEFLRKVIFVNENSFLVLFIYIVGYKIIIMSFRAPLISPIKSLIIFMAPYCFVFLLLRSLRKIVSLTKEHIC